MALDWQTLQIPLVGGLNTGMDPRALQPPALAVCRDAEFDNVGGLQTRHPYDPMSSSIFGSVAEIADTRRIVANGDELLLFTKDALYSRRASEGQWVSKGTHLAIAIDESPKFVTTGDQIQCDRATLDGTTVYVWFDGTVSVAAVDDFTGAVVMAPTFMPGGVSRPRVVALETRILLIVVQADHYIVCYALDPANPATALAGASTTIRVGGVPPDGFTWEDYYDVVKRAGADSAFVATSTYSAGSGYAAHVVTSTPTVTSSAKARTSDGPIAVASHPAGTHVQVMRCTDVATDIKGDYLTSALVDVNINAAIETAAVTINQLTGAFRSTTDGGFYRCYAFWSAGETTDEVAWKLQYNYVNTNNAVGTTTRLAWRLSVGSRAFERAGHVYVHGVFSSAADGEFEGPQLQNTYFLLRDDGRLCGKAVTSRAGGFTYDSGDGYTSTRGHLPGVAGAGDRYLWCAQRRRAVPLADGSEKGYGARSPVDVTISFDDDRARRCVRLGETGYITGAEILQYDGVRLTEVGFHIYPWFLDEPYTGAGGDLADGTYTFKPTFRWDNAKGERERSTTAEYVDVTVSGGPKLAGFISTSPTDLTHKTGYASEIALEIWRTEKNPASTDAPFNLTTSRDPAELTGSNRYIANDTTASTLGIYEDELSDADLLTHEANEEVGTILESLAPPPAQIIVATQDRVFLAGVAGDPDRVWYSRLRVDGMVASFHEQNTIAIPPAGGAITALWVLAETLVVAREHAIYVVPGEGYQNDGSGQNFGPARIVSGDCGVESQEANGRTDLGQIFKSAKGWYLLTAGWNVQYIGEPVAAFDDEPILAVHVLEDRHQVRVLTADRMLVWDYLVNQWSEWTVAGGISACVWNGVHILLRSFVDADDETVHQVSEESTTFNEVDYGIDIETPWIKVNDLQGRGRVRWALLLAEWRSLHRVRVRCARDYQTSAPLNATGALHLATNALGNPAWAATLRALREGLTLTIQTLDTGMDPWTIEVRDGYRYNIDAVPVAAWERRAGNVGVLIFADGSGASNPTVAELEAALVAGSRLLRVETPDPNTTREIVEDDLEHVLTFATVADTINWFDDRAWTPDRALVGAVEQMRHGPSIQRVQAIKLRLTAIAWASEGSGTPTDLTTPPTGGEALRLTGLGLEVGVERGLNRRLNAAQKTG